MRLPGIFGTTLASIPAQLPYLHAQADAVAQWRSLLPQQGLRVGLAWRGNANFENDAERSLPSLMALAPLAATPVHFVSLQKGEGEDDAPPAGMHIFPAASRINDFADTAAVIANLDLVISVDTAVAHLVGALGKPCWLLLPDYRCDWRWMTGREDTPWYPAMRLFRQPRGGGWPEVVAQLATALLSLGSSAAPGPQSAPGR
jgi:hypothetical protein